MWVQTGYKWFQVNYECPSVKLVEVWNAKVRRVYTIFKGLKVSSLVG